MKKKISPEEKASDLLSRKLFEDAEKDILQIIALCDEKVQIEYWQKVHKMAKTINLVNKAKLKRAQ